MRSWFAALLLFVTVALPAAAQNVARDVVVRSSLSPASGAVIGQHMSLYIDVLFKDDMPRPPRVSIGEVAGAQVMRLESQATTLNDRIGGESYIGQRFEFALYPRRGGTLAIPAAEVTLLDRAGDVTGNVKGQPMTADIAVPPGIDPSGPVIATGSLKLEQHWLPAQVSSLKPGDAVVRTIVRTAAGVPGMAMRDLVFTAPPGVRVYAEPPVNDDHIERGELSGKRTDRVTYVFETAGTFSLPAVVQPWWDLSAKAVKRGEGKALAVTVIAPPQPVDWKRPAIAGALVIALLALAFPRARSWWTARHAAWLASERKAFADLVASVRHDDVGAIYRRFVQWRAHIVPPDTLAPLAITLERALFGPEPAAWSPTDRQSFLDTLHKVREAHTAAQAPVAPALPPLNPTT